MSVIPLNELIEVLEELQEYEKQILKKEKQKLIKGSKKNNRNQIEAQIIQMEYDLKAKHNNELDELEETGSIFSYIYNYHYYNFYYYNFYYYHCYYLFILFLFDLNSFK